MEIIDDADVFVKVICPCCGREMEVSLEDFSHMSYQDTFYDAVEIPCIECDNVLLVLKPESVY